MTQLDLFIDDNTLDLKRLKYHLGRWVDVLPKFILKNLLETMDIVDNERNKFNIYPSELDTFRLFRYLDINNIKCIILGQDPYHTPVVANGFAFGSEKFEPLPPSLKQIVKAIQKDVGTGFKCKESNSTLKYLAEQGVFLLNTILTVREGQPLSHSEIGWQHFTSAVIKVINNKTDAPFLLWGSKAQEYKKILRPDTIVFEASHPASAAYKGTTWECNHFSKVNELLKSRGQKEIIWL